MTSKKKSKSFAKSRDIADPANRLDFSALVASIRQAHEHCVAQASRAVNVSLTMRNGVIGWYIREYEQNGGDRAYYGEGLLDALAERLKGSGMRALAAGEDPGCIGIEEQGRHHAWGIGIRPPACVGVSDRRKVKT
jgi:hypothetical protein